MTSKYLAYAAACGLALMSSCTNDDTDFSGLITDPEPDPIEEWAPGLQFDYSEIVEAEEIIAAEDNDYWENWTTECVAVITYAGGEAIVTGDTGDCSIVTNGANVVARLGKKNINFYLTGASSSGSFKLYGDKRFMVTLGDLMLTNPTGAAINSQCGKSMYLVAEEGAQAILADGPTYTTVGVEDMKGCVFSEGQIIVSGRGRIDINSSGKNGIASDDYVVVRPGVLLNINSAGGSGIKTNDGVDIRGGRLNIAVEADGAKGINSEKGIQITGGRTIILNKGAIRNDVDRSVSAAAVKCDSTFTMTAGILRAESVGAGGKGINSDLNIRLLGGEVWLATFGESTVASARAIKTDGYLSIANTNVTAYSQSCAPVNALEGITLGEGFITNEDSPHLFTVTY